MRELTWLRPPSGPPPGPYVSPGLRTGIGYVLQPSAECSVILLRGNSLTLQAHFNQELYNMSQNLAMTSLPIANKPHLRVEGMAAKAKQP